MSDIDDAIPDAIPAEFIAAKTVIEKLDGFTADGWGNVIGTEKDLVDGDVERITQGKDVTEQRYYAPVAPTPAQPAPPTTKQQLLDQIAVLKGLADQLA